MVKFISNLTMSLAMKTALLIILIVIANLVLYWIFFGKKKFEQKLISKKQND